MMVLIIDRIAKQGSEFVAYGSINGVSVASGEYPTPDEAADALRQMAEYEAQSTPSPTAPTGEMSESAKRELDWLLGWEGGNAYDDLRAKLAAAREQASGATCEHGFVISCPEGCN